MWLEELVNKSDGACRQPPGGSRFPGKARQHPRQVYRELNDVSPPSTSCCSRNPWAGLLDEMLDAQERLVPLTLMWQVVSWVWHQMQRGGSTWHWPDQTSV